jgi:hypothetical protein
MNNIYNIIKMQPVLAIAFFLFAGVSSLFAQNHISVPVGHAVYYILEQAETRGLCPPLPSVKPYTRAKIVEVIDTILAAEPKRLGGLSEAEKKILENTRAEFTRGAAGFDPKKGMYRFQMEGTKNVRFSGDFGISLESLNSGALYMEGKKKYLGTDTWVTLFFRGDIGEQFSYNMDLSGGIMRAERVVLGKYDTYASELTRPEYENTRVTTMSQPLAFFPYTYQKRWDGFMFGPSPGGMSADGMEEWPQKYNIAAAMKAELSGSVLGDMLLIRFGRIQREWGAMAPGNSLVLNAAARPFLALETLFSPAPWFSFSSMTGVTEFDNAVGIESWNFQNAYSVSLAEINIKEYFHIDFGSSVVWPKRLEFGYLFPLIDNYFYQNFIGDFDNVAIHLNIRGQYPGIGKLWVSFFMDEMEISSMSKAFDLDRHMFAYQAGLQGIIPGLPFASITASYTKIEPYNYTHHRYPTPWYGDNLMETAYVSNGVSLGHYLPPNSDEIKLRFDIRPLLQTSSHFQYQLIRHGADFGSHQVDGSSLVSELDPDGRGEKQSLRKNFLKDGAYQWMHIIKVGASHTFKGLPITIFGEAGFVYSYFTDISNEKYLNYYPTPEGQTPREPAAGEYLKSSAFILTLGFRIFL